MKNRWWIRIIASALVALPAAASPSFAEADHAIDRDYLGANVHKAATQDAAKTGSADARPTADRVTGRVSASASTSSDAAAGTLVDAYGYLPIVGLGATDAFSYGEVTHRFDRLTRSSHSVTVRFAEVTSTHSASAPRSAGYGGYTAGSAWSIAQADIVVEYYDCSPGSPGCSYTDVERISIPLPDGADQSFVLESLQDTGSSTSVIVRACLVARARSSGPSARADSQVSGRIASISVL